MAGVIVGNKSLGGTTKSVWGSGLSAYDLAVRYENYDKSVQEWLKSLKGESVELRQDGNKLEWKYTNEEDWHVFVDIDSIIEESVTEKVAEQISQQVAPIVQEQMSQYAPTQVQNTLPNQGDPGVFYIIRGEEGGDG